MNICDDFYQFLVRAKSAIQNEVDDELQTLFDEKSPVKNEPLKPVAEDLFSIVQSRGGKEKLRAGSKLEEISSCSQGCF